MKAAVFVSLLFVLCVCQCPDSDHPYKSSFPRWDGHRVSDVPPPPKDFDCGMRKLALTYASQLFGPVDLDVVHDSLNLSYCNAARPQHRPWNMILPPVVDDSAKDTLSYFIAPNGNDNNDGTISSPWKTLTRARDQIRKIPLQNRNTITVFLREGTYYLTETFTLGSQDSGNLDQPIIYRNYNNEKVTLSGGQLLSVTWESAPGMPGVYMAHVPSGIPEFSGFFADGQRQLRARWPNGLPWVPEDGYTVSGDKATDATATGVRLKNNVVVRDATTGNVISNGAMFPQNQSFEFKVEVSASWHVRRPTCSTFSAYSGGTADRFDTTYNYPFWNSAVPSSMYYNALSGRTWNNPESGFIHMYHTSGWGNWMFQIGKIDKTEKQISFSSGGFQEARGAPTIQRNRFYVENIFEELDTKTEWYLNTSTSTLYWFPQNSPPKTSTLLEVAILPRIVAILGTRADPAEFIQFSGIRFTHSTTTFMSLHEVPSGGDWAVHRSAAFFVEGARGINISGNFFDQVDGNGIFFSNFVQESTIERNLFSFVGDSCVLLVGSARLMDGFSATDQPAYNNINRNHMHDWGVWTKQTAGYFQAVSHHNNITKNIMYNAPRATMNINDGFGGGTIISQNLNFNAVRESSDHGNFNSWDRQPYLYYSASATNKMGFVPETQIIRNNFLIRESFTTPSSNDYSLDHDDGSGCYLDSANFLVYGGIKFRDGFDKVADGNLIVYPTGSQPYGCAFQVNGFNTDAFTRNTVVSETGQFYGYCAGYSGEVGNRFKVAQNQYFTPNKTTLPFDDGGCGPTVTSLKEFQAAGYDVGSTQSDKITTTEILAIAEKLIGSSVVG